MTIGVYALPYVRIGVRALPYVTVEVYALPYVAGAIRDRASRLARGVQVLGVWIDTKQM